jgi:hypothetical protein
MKTYKKTFLPDFIEYKGKTYHMNSSISSSMQLSKTKAKTVLKTIKTTRVKVVIVEVLSKNLKGKTDLYGKPYEPTKFIFTTK